MRIPRCFHSAHPTFLFGSFYIMLAFVTFPHLDRVVTFLAMPKFKCFYVTSVNFEPLEDKFVFDFHVTFAKNSKSFLKNMSYTLSVVEIVSKWPLDLQPSAAQALLRFFVPQEQKSI